MQQVNFFMNCLLKIPEIRKLSQLFWSHENNMLVRTNFLIFPKIGGAKEKIKEKQRQITKRKKKRNFKVMCFSKLVLNKS